MAFSELLKNAERFARENSTTILTGVGVTGTVTTAYLTGRASFKAAEILREDATMKVAAKNGAEVDTPGDVLTFREKAHLVWHLYIPPVGVGGVTIASIIMANRLSSKKAAALAAAYGISERAFQEYREKVIERMGESRERRVRDELAQDRVLRTTDRPIVIIGEGKVLCFDQFMGRYFESTMEELRQAQNRVNSDILNHMYASLSSFYDELGLPPTTVSDELGWNSASELIELQFSSVLTTDNRPCLAFDFVTPPRNDYTNSY